MTTSSSSYSAWSQRGESLQNIVCNPVSLQIVSAAVSGSSGVYLMSYKVKTSKYWCRHQNLRVVCFIVHSQAVPWQFPGESPLLAFPVAFWTARVTNTWQEIAKFTDGLVFSQECVVHGNAVHLVSHGFLKPRELHVVPLL